MVELFEARKPKDPAAISEIDGMVKDGGVVKGQRKLIIVPDDAAEPREYSMPRGVHINVHEGERVRAGEQLMNGPSNPHDILRVLGEKELARPSAHGKRNDACENGAERSGNLHPFLNHEGHEEREGREDQIVCSSEPWR